MAVRLSEKKRCDVIWSDMKSSKVKQRKKRCRKATEEERREDNRRKKKRLEEKARKCNMK